MFFKIVQIGNSQGIRIPKAIIEQCELEDEVEAIVEDKKIILSAKRKVRDGWAELFDDEPISEDLEDWLNLDLESE